MSYYNCNMNACRCNCEMNSCNKMDKYPIGMAYVPVQEWKNVISAKEGICYGTIFSELVLPFYGCRNGGR